MHQPSPRNIFITGSTGYMGSRLIPLLVQRGHAVQALVRTGSEHKLPVQCTPVAADALLQGAYIKALRGADTLVHLIGVAHPSPAKAAQFRSIDQVSAQVALHAAQAAGVRHMVYLSVAQPAAMMRDYVAVRAYCETLIRESGIAATFLRPWYVLGPGHRWPYALLPFYWLCERLPFARDGAQRLGLVTLTQMLNALVWAVEHPPIAVHVLDVPKIRTIRL
jgi:uncharacterized protein YbjT (DUF2867 family)